MGFIAVKCPECGADIQLDDSREFGFCNYCGAKVVQDKVVVEHRGTVKVDETEKLENLYVLARRARDDNNSEKASIYYDKILQQDPNSWEANFYSVFFQSMNCNIAQIKSAAVRLTNCEDTVLKLIKETVTDEDEREAAVTEIAERLLNISRLLYSSASDHYANISPSIQSKYKQESLDRCRSAFQIDYYLGDYIVMIFGDQYKDIAVICWKCAINLHKTLVPHFENPAENKAIVLKYADKIKKYEPDYPTPVVDTSSGGCYVATCVYGSYDCPQVWTLRRYRDDTLASTWYGRAFIRTYYAVSPTLVAWFGHTDWFKKLWRGKLDRMVESLRENGVEDTPYNDKPW